MKIRGKLILDRVSLDLASGETLGLVGESGCGKSMTALAIMGLLPHGAQVTGRVLLDGKDLLSMPERAMREARGRDMGMVFQEPMTALNPVHRIGDQVAETIRIHTGVSRGESLDKADETLLRVGLPPEQAGPERYPHELSGGQRQRVIIAMAVALKPKLLIADEPTTALDVTTQAQVLELLRTLCDEDGTGLLLITHDLAVVADMADQVAIMKEGTIVERDETGKFFSGTRHEYSRKLLLAATHRPVRNGPRPGPDSDVILKADNVVREYPVQGTGFSLSPRKPVRAVDGVSFDIRKGESLGLVGESGCGKSTLSRVLMGLDRAQGGTVRLEGMDVSPKNTPEMRQVRQKIQLVFQDPLGSFNPRHRVERVISEPFHLLDTPISAVERRKRVEEMLERVKLPLSAADRFPHQFSGGERQRIAIARALITRPSIVVLDEPVSALDVSVRADVLNLLAELSEKFGLSYLFISHDLHVVRNITDRVMIMHEGRIVETGYTEKVFTKPSNPYTLSLINATPTLDPTFGPDESSCGLGEGDPDSGFTDDGFTDDGSTDDGTAAGGSAGDDDMPRPAAAR